MQSTQSDYRDVNVLYHELTTSSESLDTGHLAEKLSSILLRLLRHVDDLQIEVNELKQMKENGL